MLLLTHAVQPAMADWTDNPFAAPPPKPQRPPAPPQSPFADPSVTTAQRQPPSGDFNPFEQQQQPVSGDQIGAGASSFNKANPPPRPAAPPAAEVRAVLDFAVPKFEF